MHTRARTEGEEDGSKGGKKNGVRADGNKCGSTRAVHE